MDLITSYKSMCSDYDFVTQYGETGVGKYGRLFEFKNTNYRTITAFIKNYETFKKGADGIKRSEWELNVHHGQEQLKQHTVNMIKSKLFSKNKSIYYKTKKGEIIDKLGDKFTIEEQWIILYLLLLDGYFENIPNYILVKTKDIMENYLVYEQNINVINDMLKKFIIESKSLDIEDIFKLDYFYYDTFNRSYNKNGKMFDFLSLYINSSKIEKEKFQDYIINNYNEYKNLTRIAKGTEGEKAIDARNKLSNFPQEVIIQKYKPSGSYNKNMLIDTTKMLYLSNYINDKKYNDFMTFISNVLDRYSEIESIDKDKLKNFIVFDNRDVFELIYINVFNPDYLENVDEVEDDENNEISIVNDAQSKTIIESIEDVRSVNGILKRKALERAKYRCELEELCDCSSHYFTNKKNDKNYMEMHHLIPREFSNDFEVSIEQIDNYVSLCPRCHRFLHFAKDRERKGALHYLYSKRIENLKLKGIYIEEEELKKYYKIND